MRRWWSPFVLRAPVCLVLATAMTPDAAAASFDCGKASTAVEKLICSSPELSDLDTQMAKAYGRSSQQRPDAEKAMQRQWLIERNKCTDVTCLKRAYERRLNALQGPPPPGAPTPAGAPARAPSFTQAPFISPLIINDLCASLSDHGDQVLVINLTDAQDSNRYFGKVETREAKGQNPYVFYRPADDDDPSASRAEFGYRYVGRTASGIDVLMTTESGGGSGVFENLLLVKVEEDRHGFDLNAPVGNIETATFKKPRLLIRKLGEIGLGDRWQGDLKITGNQLSIGKDRGPLSKVEPSRSRTIRIDPGP